MVLWYTTQLPVLWITPSFTYLVIQLSSFSHPLILWLSSIPFPWSLFLSSCLLRLLLLRYPGLLISKARELFPVVFIFIPPTVSFHTSMTDSFEFSPIKFSYFFFNCSATPFTFFPSLFKSISQGLSCEYTCLSPQYSVPQNTQLCSHLMVFSNLVCRNVYLTCMYLQSL